MKLKVIKMVPDVQKRWPDIRLPLTKVGVNNVRKLLKIPREGKRPIILLSIFDCFVDLPYSQKGTHMSRNLEAINEILEEIVRKPVYDLEDLCEDIAKEIMKRHEYATKCEVGMESRYMIPGETPSGKPIQDFVKIVARARASRNEGPEGSKGPEASKRPQRPEIKREIGAEIKGVIMHPRQKEKRGCIQRALVSLHVQVPETHNVRIDRIVDVLEKSVSTKTYGFLSENDEREVILEAGTRPKSVNKVVEDILKEAARTFVDVPDDMKVTSKCIMLETLLTYDTFAERSMTLGEIRERSGRDWGNEGVEGT